MKKSILTIVSSMMLCLTLQAQTVCTIPYSYGFEGNRLFHDGWNVADLNHDGFTWVSDPYHWEQVAPNDGDRQARKVVVYGK